MHDLDDLHAIEDELNSRSGKLTKEDIFDIPMNGHNNTAQSEFKQNEKNHVEKIRQRRRGAEQTRDEILRLMVTE